MTAEALTGTVSAAAPKTRIHTDLIFMTSSICCVWARNAVQTSRLRSGATTDVHLTRAPLPGGRDNHARGDYDRSPSGCLCWGAMLALRRVLVLVSVVAAF